jgi:uncharacterized Zn finger protein (UPF0148 family)
MALVHQAANRARCPRCGGTLYRGYDGDLCCMFCGEYVYVIPDGVRLAAPSPDPTHGPRKRQRRAGAATAA